MTKTFDEALKELTSGPYEPWQVTKLQLDHQQAEITQLRGNLSLAEEGLANYAKEVKLLRDQRDSNLAKEVETVSRLNAEIERLRAIIQPCPACSAMDGFLGVGAGPPLPSDAELRADCAPEPCEQLPVIENWAAFASESKDPAVRNMYADFKAVLQAAEAARDEAPCKCDRTLPHRFVEGECGAMNSEGAQ